MFATLLLFIILFPLIGLQGLKQFKTVSLHILWRRSRALLIFRVSRVAAILPVR
jgi:hypothetical protein